MSLTPRLLERYHVFLASPGDVNAERQAVRRFFDDYNRSTAHLWNVEFRVIDWENYATIGVGRPQELITRQTLEKYKSSLALVVGIMGQRFGSPSGNAESGTEEEFNWAMETNKETGFPEIKWFFRKSVTLEMPSDPDELLKAAEQWRKVLAFRKRMQDFNKPVFYMEYPGADRFRDVFDRDLMLWLTDPLRPWAAKRAAEIAASSDAPFAAALPPDFDCQLYREAVLKRFDKLNFEMLDTTGAFYSGVRLWSVFVPQSARECHQYNPRLLEIPKEHQKRLLESGEISAEDLGATEMRADELRREYFSQPLRPVLEVIDEALRTPLFRTSHRLVILGDPGSGKSSLIRYLALRWASIADRTELITQPIPMVIELGSYGRWQCEGRRGFVRFMEEAPVWHNWHRGLLERLLEQPGGVVLLLDGLDEIFNLKTREDVVNDIQRFSNEHPQTPIVMTSRGVGYQPQRLRDAEFRHFMLQDLDADQIDAFVDRWHEETFDDPAQGGPKRERLKKAIHNSRSIAMLAGNPLLLTMMAILNRNQELPRDRIDLYGQAARVLLHQWDTERALADFPGLSAEIGWREKTDMLRRVASFMQGGPSGLKGNMIDGPTLTTLIEIYLHSELHFEQSRAAARAVVEHLRQRNFILCFVGADSYGFVHRTFLEYFCAADFVHQFNIAKTLSEEGLIALFDEHCYHDEWREVLRLICGQIDEQFVGRIVGHLAARTDLKEWDSHSYLPELALATLLVQEARNTQRLEAVGETVFGLIVEVVRRASGPFVPREIQKLLDELIDAIESVGTRWPGAARFLPLSVPTFMYSNGGGQFIWARLVAAIEGNVARERIHMFVSKSEYYEVRAGAITLLAVKWPDEATRNLLTDRAVQDKDRQVRRAALDSLTEKWPDEATRNLLADRASHDPDAGLRRVALDSMASKWPDEATRNLLADRASHDPDAGSRRVALDSMASKWPDEATRNLLADRAIEDADEFSRGYAASLVVKSHSEFGRRLYTRDLDGVGPYLDPRSPLAREHIKECAARVGLPAGQLETELAALSQLLGWDVTVGARPQRPAMPPARARRKKKR
jgi:hypothetical protein